MKRGKKIEAKLARRQAATPTVSNPKLKYHTPGSQNLHKQ